MAARAYLHPSPWLKLLDDWYYETEDTPDRVEYGEELPPGYSDDIKETWFDPNLFDAQQLPHFYYEEEKSELSRKISQEIKNNPGFQSVLKCLIRYRCLIEEQGAEPMRLEGNWGKWGAWMTNKTFYMPGAGAELSKMVAFLGSYQASIVGEKKVSLEKTRYSIEIVDPKGWESGTRISPKFMGVNIREMYLKLAGKPTDRNYFIPNEPRVPRHWWHSWLPIPFQNRGGMIIFHFKFDVVEDHCNTNCDFYFPVGEGEKRKNLTLEERIAYGASH